MLSTLTTPSKISYFYSQHITYDDVDFKYWHYREIDEIIEDGLCKCHDAGRFFYDMLKRINAKPVRYFMEIHGIPPEDGELSAYTDNHTIVTFIQDDFYYYIEGTWWQCYGIHGPFATPLALLRTVNSLYRTIWQADPVNTAPPTLNFKFFEFNEEALDKELHKSSYFHSNEIGIKRFVELVKGKEIDITVRDTPLCIYEDSKNALIYVDESDSAESNFHALRNLCNEHHITNVLCNKESDVESIRHKLGSSSERIIKFIKTNETNYTLFINDIEVELHKSNIKEPQLIKNEKYELHWFEDDRMHKHRPVARLLLHELGLI